LTSLIFGKTSQNQQERSSLTTSTRLYYISVYYLHFKKTWRARSSVQRSAA
jgi:hypothetical protein